MGPVDKIKSGKRGRPRAANYFDTDEDKALFEKLYVKNRTKIRAAFKDNLRYNEIMNRLENRLEKAKKKGDKHKIEEIEDAIEFQKKLPRQKVSTAKSSFAYDVYLRMMTEKSTLSESFSTEINTTAYTSSHERMVHNFLNGIRKFKDDYVRLVNDMRSYGYKLETLPWKYIGDKTWTADFTTILASKDKGEIVNNNVNGLVSISQKRNIGVSKNKTVIVKLTNSPDSMSYDFI